MATIVDLIIPRVVTKPVKLPNGDIMPPGTEWSVDIQRMAQVLYCVKFTDKSRVRVRHSLDNVNPFGINQRGVVSTERTVGLKITVLFKVQQRSVGC